MEIILSLLGVIGIGGIITTYVNKKKEIEFKKNEEKQRRYKCVIVFMEACIDEKKIKFLPPDRDFRDKEEIIQALEFEYNQMILYSGAEVLKYMKIFIKNPNRENFYKAIICMRRDLWGIKMEHEIEGVINE